MNRDQFLRERMTGIGGSDMAGVLGVSRYKTPTAIWRQKRGIDAPAPDNEAMMLGRILEPVVLQLYEQRTGHRVQKPQGLLRHPQHPFMIANLDAFVPGRVVEAKTSFDARDWGIEGTDDIPVDYFMQTQHYMCVTGYKVADVPVFFRGVREDSFRIYTVEADEDLHAAMVEEAGAFWQRVQAAVEPDPVTFEEMSARWTQRLAASKTSTVRDATPELVAAVGELRAIRDDIALLETARDALTQVIQMGMGECDVLAHDGRPLVTWRLTKPRRTFDAKRLEAEQPEVHAAYMRDGAQSRVFLVK